MSASNEPLFHIVKRDSIKTRTKIIIYAASVLIAMLISAVFVTLSSDRGSFFDFFGSMFSGVFGTERRFWIFLRSTALLLGVALALVPAFKMKFWNLGGNGQIMIACLMTLFCMRTFGGILPDPVIWILEIIFAIGAAVIWAVIPALFKALFKTNESLFTLMMNYVAAGLITWAITVWEPTGSGSLSAATYGRLPVLGNEYILTIIIVALLVVFEYFYLNKSKHGYEISIVGDSINTARYIGLSYKKVVLRTLVLSGAICGIIGLLLTGEISYTVNTDIAENMGFTGIMAAWLAQFNPLIMIGTSAFIIFVNKGMNEVIKTFGFRNSALPNVILGIIFFFVIACEFFIQYKIIFSPKAKAFLDKTASPFIKLKNAAVALFSKVFKKGGNR